MALKELMNYSNEFNKEVDKSNLSAEKYVYFTDQGHLTKLDYKLLTFCLMLQNQMVTFLILN